MIFKIKAKESLWVNEWQIIILNECKHDIAVDLGHTELLVKTMTIKQGTGIPDAFEKA